MTKLFGERRFMTVQEVCDELGIATSTWRDWRARGKGPKCLKLPNGQLRIRRADFERWTTNLEEAA